MGWRTYVQLWINHECVIDHKVALGSPIQTMRFASVVSGCLGAEDNIGWAYAGPLIVLYLHRSSKWVT